LPVEPATSALYAGIGSRDTPADALEICELAGEALAWQGWTLRSGHAPGADQAFGRGAGRQAEVYLPWPTFERAVDIEAASIMERPNDAAYALAAQHHPAWDSLSRGARALHARNCHQILGRDLATPVGFVLCWHQGSGGTMQAVRLAQARGIRVFNLADGETLWRVQRMIEHYRVESDPDAASAVGGL
jgi:hypothetical protein